MIKKENNTTDCDTQSTMVLYKAVQTYLHYVTWVVYGYGVTYIIYIIGYNAIHNAPLWVF